MGKKQWLDKESWATRLGDKAKAIQKTLGALLPAPSHVSGIISAQAIGRSSSNSSFTRFISL